MGFCPAVALIISSSSAKKHSQIPAERRGKSKWSNGLGGPYGPKI
jgi:hypothetical protein